LIDPSTTIHILRNRHGARAQGPAADGGRVACLRAPDARSIERIAERQARRRPI